MFGFLSGIFSGEIANVDVVELESTNVFSFLSGLVGFKKRASRNSSEVAIRATSSGIYAPSASKRFAVGTGASEAPLALVLNAILDALGPSRKILRLATGSRQTRRTVSAEFGLAEPLLAMVGLRLSPSKSQQELEQSIRGH